MSNLSLQFLLKFSVCYTLVSTVKHLLF